MTKKKDQVEKLLGAAQKASEAFQDVKQLTNEWNREQAAPPAAPAAASLRAQPALNPAQEMKAQRVLVRQFEDRWGDISGRFRDITPMGSIANAEGMASHSKPITLQYAYNTALNYFAEISGDEFLGSYILAMGLNDSQQRQATLGAITNIIRGGTTALEPQMVMGRNPAAGAAVEDLSPEEFAQIVTNPGEFRSLTFHKQEQFIAHAQEVVDSYAKRGRQAQALERTMAAIATGNLTNVLNDSEVAELHDTVAKLRETGFFAETQGTSSSVYTFDEEWARQHPAKAAAEAYYIQQRFPNATIKFGGDGIASDIFNAIGKPIDVIATPFSTLATQTTRSIRHLFDNGSVPELQAERDKLTQELRHAPLSERDDLLNAIDNIDDRIGVITGESLGGEETRNLMRRAIDSDTANLGFARNIVEGTGLLPGDGGYDVAVGTTMIAGSIVFDPFTYVVGAAQGVRAARNIPAIAGATDSAHTVRGLVARWVYNRMKSTPEEFISKMNVGQTLLDLAASPYGRERVLSLLGKHLDNSFLRSTIMEAAATGDARTIENTLIQFATQYTEGAKLTVLTNRAETLARDLNEFERLDDVRRLAKTGAAEFDDLTEQVARMLDEGDLADPVALSDAQGRLAQLDEALHPDGLDLVDEAIAARPRTSPPGRALFDMGVYDEELELVRSQGTLESYGKNVWGSLDPETGLRRYFYVEEGKVLGVRNVQPDGHVVTLVSEQATGKGIASRLLNAHWDDLGVGSDPAKMVEAINQQDFSEGGAALNHAAARDRLLGLSGVGTRYDELAASAVRNREELAVTRSLVHTGTNTVKPLEFGSLRSLKKEADGWLRALGDISDDLADFPAGPSVPSAFAPKAKQLFKSLHQAFRPSGFGEGAEAVAGLGKRAFFLPGIPIPEAGLVDAYERSRNAFIAVARTLKVDEDTIARVMGQWDDLVALGDREASYKWFTNAWDEFLSASKLDPTAKASLTRLWDSTFEQWGSDFIRVNAAGEYAQREPLLYKTVVDPGDGSLMKAGQPVFSADVLSHGVFLPDLETVLKAMYPKYMKTMNFQSANAATNIWKRLVLSAKLPFSLPAKIVGELTMARMSAYDLAGLSPGGVLDWMKSIMARGKYSEFANADEAFALGNVMRDYEREGRNFNRAMSMKMLVSADGDDYYRALSGRLEALAKSPELRYVLEAQSPQALKAAMFAPDAPSYLQEAARRWAQAEGGLDVSLERVWNYAHKDVLGSGKFAQDMKYALRGGKLADGTELGTISFADRLRDEVMAGRYIPGIREVHGRFGAGISTSKALRPNLIARANDWAFRVFYAAPESKLGRLPAYRQLATKYHTRMVKMGYPEAVAHRIASAAAQEDVAGMFFRIGAHTSGEMMMRNVSPFFPAYRELFDTWLLNIPKRLGGPVLGHLYMANRMGTLFRGLEAGGIIERQPDGSLGINMPFLNPIVNALMPGGEQYEVRASLSSIFGMLPFPSPDIESWKDAVAETLPSLGGGLGTPLTMGASALLDRAEEGWQHDLADILAPFGVGDIGGNWSRLYSGIALYTGMDPVPPWEKFTNPDFKESMVHSAIDDSLRILVGSGAPQYQAPNPADFNLLNPDGVKEFRRQYMDWQARLITDAEHLAGSRYLTRSLLSMTLPFSSRATIEEQDSITAIWGLLNAEGLPQEVRDGMVSPLLASFKSAYPYADWYTIGKTEAMSQRGASDDVALSQDMEALFAAGLRKVRTPEDYAVWSMGMNAFSQYRAKRAAIYAEFENNPVDYLLNGGEAREKLVKLDGQWAAFLATSDNIATQDRQTPFSTMLERAKVEWYGKRGQNDIESAVSRELLSRLPVVAEAVEAGTYSEIRRQLLDNIRYHAENETGAAKTMWTTLDKYYNKVADPYYNQLDKLYNTANSYAANDPRRAAAFQDIRSFIATSKPRTINGVKFPTPEQVSFFTKSPEEQRAYITDKLAWGHPEWLTPFQQEVAGLRPAGRGGKAVEELTNFVTDTEQAFDKAYPSYYASGYDGARAALDRAQAAKAAELGLNETWRLWNAPTYVKMDNAGVADGPAWDQAVNFANSARQSITRAGYVLDSSSPNATPTQQWLFGRLDGLYKSDAQFRDVIDRTAMALAEDENPVSRQDVYWQIFLGGYGNAPATLI